MRQDTDKENLTIGPLELITLCVTNGDDAGNGDGAFVFWPP